VELMAIGAAQVGNSRAPLLDERGIPLIGGELGLELRFSGKRDERLPEILLLFRCEFGHLLRHEFHHFPSFEFGAAEIIRTNDMRWIEQASQPFARGKSPEVGSRLGTLWM